MRFTSLQLLLLTQTVLLLASSSSAIGPSFRSYGIIPNKNKTVKAKNKKTKQPQAKPAAVLAKKNKSNTSASAAVSVDYGAIGKYIGGLGVQVSALYLVWSTIDRIIPSLLTTSTQDETKGLLPRWASFLLVYFINLQASKFNPLPTIVKEGKYSSPGRKRPSWTPPGWVFALMWPFFVFGTRAYTLAVIAEKIGYYANPVTMSLMLHLGMSTLWSTINRVEERLGVSILMLYGMVITKAGTAYLAYQIDPTTGIALAATLSWLIAAAALGTDTWRINPDPKTGKRELLYPVKYK